jgi:hypothetical protein
MICNCEKYTDLADLPSLNKRGHNTMTIIDMLTLVAECINTEHQLYICGTCGQFWQRSLARMRGNKPYIFKVPNIEIEQWKAKQFVQPDELISWSDHVQQYLNKVNFEEHVANCRREGCDNHAVNLSVFCALHHMDNIGIKISLPNDYLWFPPYVKENFELSIAQLKQLPTYKPYHENKIGH